MATKQENIDIERQQVRELKPYVTAIRDLPDEYLDPMVNIGILQPSTILEHALAETGGYAVVSLDTNDLNDPCSSDAKLVSVRTSDKESRYSACIGGLHNKIGSIRAMVTERIHNKSYYFHIPRSVYSYITKSTQCIEIPFDTGGQPRRVTNKRGINWWDYEEKTFRDLACNHKDPVTRRMEHNQRFFEQLPGIRGGRVTGQLSMTPNAIRKRAARARAREAQRG